MRRAALKIAKFISALNFFGIALATCAGFGVACAADLDFGKSAVAALIVVSARRNVAGDIDIYVAFHRIPPSVFCAVLRKIFKAP